MFTDHVYMKSESFKMEERNGGISKKCRHHVTPSSHHPHKFTVYLKSTRIPLYPIVALMGSPTYELAKKLARILFQLNGKMEAFSGNSSKCADRVRKNQRMKGTRWSVLTLSAVFLCIM